MLLHDVISRRWSSPSRVIPIAGCLCFLYYLVFVSWFSTEWKVVWKQMELDHVEDESLRGIGNATLGFQKLLVINMPSRTDRRDATTLAFATSNLAIEFIEGVKGDSIPENAFPPGDSTESIKLPKGIKGSWRSHMNALQHIVRKNLSTAVIFEDDVDWDIHLTTQLRTFALASRLLSNQNFSTDLPHYNVQTSNNPETEESIHNNTSPNPISENLYSLPLSRVPSLYPTPTLSPYGDPTKWDVLWLGHCGVGFPHAPTSPTTSPNSANILLTLQNDTTVPSPKHLRAHPFGPLDALATSHSPHTRVYHRATGGALCTVAYAVSQRGARRLLAEFGVRRWGRIWDAELGGWCAGSDLPTEPVKENESEESKKGRGREEPERVCLTVQPPIFAHHHPTGGESNIGGLGGGYARSVETKYVRWSVRMNLDRLVSGYGNGEEGLVDQWPD